METDGPWQRWEITPRAHLYVTPSRKWKVTAARVFLHAPLQAATVTATALVPPLLNRGSRSHPSIAALHARLEELYGASAGAGVVKFGEIQSVYVALDVVQDAFVSAAGLVRDGLGLLVELLTSPALDAEGRFPSAAVEQEKANLAHRIRSVYNDKARYAMIRCIQELCPGEPYALQANGRLEDLRVLGPGEVTGRWRALLDTAVVDVFAVGDPAVLEEVLAGALQQLSGQRDATLGTRPLASPTEVRTVHERDDVQQGKLVLGYRTPVQGADPRLAAMAVLNGVLGGFPHSKLFRNVRERASLAYYAGSSWDPFKGVLFVSAGIDPPRYEQCLALIQEQVAALANGEVSDDELRFTKAGLLDDLRTEEDEPHRMMDAAARQLLLRGRIRSLQERAEEIEGVRRQDVAELAAGLQLSTVYFLRGGPDGAVGEARA